MSENIHELDRASSEGSTRSRLFHERLKNSIEIQKRYALPLYQEIWPEFNIFENDDESNQGKHAQNVRDLLSILDYSGIDKLIVAPGRGEIQVSQRFRSVDDRGFTQDFSLRTYNVDGNKAEYYKLKENRESIEFTIPRLYGFGIVKGYSVGDGVENGLIYFVIYELPPIIDDLLNNNLSTEEHNNVKDGDSSSAMYIDRSDIRKYIYEDAEWGIEYPSLEDFNQLQSISEQRANAPSKQKGLSDY